MRGSTSHADTLYHQVLTEATVAKVLFADGRSPDDTLTATGVEFRLGSDAYVVHAQKEVIISAGTIKSPQLLELSGIGRKDVLDRLGVDVNLQYGLINTLLFQVYRLSSMMKFHFRLMI
jgi:choline dehydrogenase-like flavoprotein